MTGEPPGEPDPHLLRFDRLRDYVRSSRAPWRQIGDSVQFLTTRGAGSRLDIEATGNALASALRDHFAAQITWRAAEGLASAAPDASAKRVLTGPQKRLAGVSAAVLAVAAVAAPSTAVSALFILLAALFGLMIAARVCLVAVSAAAAPSGASFKNGDDELPTITILVPLFREASALPGLASALARLDYPPAKLDVKLLLEEGDLETVAEARRLNADGRFDLVIVPPSAPQTKPKALNYALATARGDLVVIYDAEDEPEPAQLRLAAGTFAAAGPELACVQAKLNFYNADDNWLTRLFTLEYCLWFDHLLPALDRIGAPVPLGGTSNIFRTDALIEAGGWDAHNVTEDADLGLRLARGGWKTAVIDATTFEEANCSLPNWIRQRSRWMKGFMQTWLVHRRGDVSADWRSILAIDLFVGGTVFCALAAPLLWIASLSGWLADQSPFGMPAGAAIAALSFGNVALIALAAAAPLSRGLFRLAPWALLMPVYWVLMSWAAYIALWQLATRPHYWEKTEHGLSAGAESRRRNALRSLGFD